MRHNNVLEDITKNIINGLETKVEFDSKGKRIPLTILQYQKCILSQEIKIIGYNRKLWVYHEGMYHSFDNPKKAEFFIKECIKKIDAVELVDCNLVKKVLAQIVSEYYEISHICNNEITYINMKSDVLAIHKDGHIEHLPHDPKYNFAYKLSYDYDENAQAPIFNKFLATSLKDMELINVISEFLGFVLDRNSKNYEKALFLLGDGSNGKSTLINIIKSLFGYSNISTVELSEMSNAQMVALMDSKLLNISADASRKGLDTAIFKKLITGEPVQAKHVFKNPFSIENLPKQIVAMNKLPLNGGDNSYGFYRRLLIIPFSVKIEEKDKDYDLESKIIRQELPAVLNFAIQGMLRLKSQGQFTKAKAMNNALTAYKESSNYVELFIEEEQYIAVDESTKKGTSIAKLYDDYKAWCTSLGYNPYSATYLSTELTRLGYIEYKNSTKHFRLIKNKLQNETGFSPLNEEDDDYS
jgi:putative DNA primase/helicase